MLSDDEGLIVRTTGADLAVAVPAPPPVAVARRASARFLERLESGKVVHTFPECFVCGHRRAPGDGLRLFAGPLDGGLGDRAGERVAAWRPDAAFLDEAGHLRPEFVTGWPLAVDSARPGSRRRYAGTAVFDARGRLLARGAAIWVAPRAA